MASSPKNEDMQGTNENLEDEYYLLIACSVYKVIPQKYNDLLDGYDNVSVILKFPS